MTLEMRPAPPALTGFVVAFAHRDEAVDGGVVRILPEPRASIQIMMADPYWVRERKPESGWRRLPAAALWGPRFEWAYGYAARRIKAVGFSLTPQGFRMLAGSPAPEWLGLISDLRLHHPSLARAIAPYANERFDTWTDRIAPALGEFFQAQAGGRNLNEAVRILATVEGGAVAEAARAVGLSERQFRRIFKDVCGVPPKRYQRAIRVDRMIRQLHPAPWERDAHAEPIPFADQPHAVREFRELIGITPSEYVALKRAGDCTLRSVAVAGIAPPNENDDEARC